MIPLQGRVKRHQCLAHRPSPAGQVPSALILVWEASIVSKGNLHTSSFHSFSSIVGALLSGRAVSGKRSCDGLSMSQAAEETRLVQHFLLQARALIVTFAISS